MFNYVTFASLIIVVKFAIIFLVNLFNFLQHLLVKFPIVLFIIVFIEGLVHFLIPFIWIKILFQILRSERNMCGIPDTCSLDRLFNSRYQFFPLHIFQSSELFQSCTFLLFLALFLFQSLALSSILLPSDRSFILSRVGNNIPRPRFFKAKVVFCLILISLLDSIKVILLFSILKIILTVLVYPSSIQNKLPQKSFVLILWWFSKHRFHQINVLFGVTSGDFLIFLFQFFQIMLELFILAFCFLSGFLFQSKDIILLIFLI
mmetsp:Transcript_42295/g.67729  ORF Transcript_42295/g.67729 Transcript_42295/m.67729 type:complete len:261 (-) Transcript_42295:794-1576(-)